MENISKKFFQVNEDGTITITNVSPYKICVIYNKFSNIYQLVPVYEQSNIEFYRDYDKAYSLIKVFDNKDELKAEELIHKLNNVHEVQES